ncbi:MAG: 3-isopropylmalate dehydratase large subunit [Oscillospiraceae bacterium]|nr:3-isopropylmalate dehydratase large subunit [Oscillospiraceae bacterium]
MKQTLIEKVISNKVGKSVYANDTIFSPIDLVMGTDATTPLTIEIFNELGLEYVVNPHRIVLVNDHFAPTKDVASANFALMLKEFARKQKIENYFEIGRSGICHVLLPEKGFIKPYDIVVGGDSHTCTYGGLSAFSTGIGSTDMACVWATGKLWFKVPDTIKVVFSGELSEGVYAKDLVLYLIGKLGINGANYDMLEFDGELIHNLDISSRLTLCNMVVEMGAKAGIINVDSVTEQYFQEKSINLEYTYLHSDDGARYKKTIEVDVSRIEPIIACPFSPGNTKPAKELANQKIDQVVIGSCTNGRIEDFRIAHKYLKDNEVHHDVKLIVIPGSQEVLKQMEEESILLDFIKCGALISPPTCGPCMGGHMGVLGNNEVGLFTTNRNFIGRNGDPSSQVYLCNPAIAAYSALKGSIQIPES